MTKRLKMKVMMQFLLTRKHNDTFSQTISELVRARTDPAARLKCINAETKQVLEQLENTYEAPEQKLVVKKVADSVNAAHYSTGMVAAGFTSTVMSPETVHEAAVLDEDIVR